MQDRYAREQAFHNATFGVGEGKRMPSISPSTLDGYRCTI